MNIKRICQERTAKEVTSKEKLGLFEFLKFKRPLTLISLTFFSFFFDFNATTND